MKKSSFRSFRFPLAFFLTVWVIATSAAPLWAVSCIYSNSVKDLSIRFDPGTLEVGDEILLAGSERYLTNFDFEFWGTSTSGPWNRDWTNLQLIEMTNTTASARVPMFYRVVRETNQTDITGSWGVGRTSLSVFEALTFYSNRYYILDSGRFMRRPPGWRDLKCRDNAEPVWG